MAVQAVAGAQRAATLICLHRFRGAQLRRFINLVFAKRFASLHLARAARRHNVARGGRAALHVQVGRRAKRGRQDLEQPSWVVCGAGGRGGAGGATRLHPPARLCFDTPHHGRKRAPVCTQWPEPRSRCTAWPSARIRASSPAAQRKLERSARTKLIWMPSAGRSRKAHRSVASYERYMSAMPARSNDQPSPPPPGSGARLVAAHAATAVEKPAASRRCTSQCRLGSGSGRCCSVVMRSAGRSCAPISPDRTSPGSASRAHTLTGRGRRAVRRLNCSAMLNTHFAPNECPMSTSGNIWGAGGWGGGRAGGGGRGGRGSRGA